MKPYSFINFWSLFLPALLLASLKIHGQDCSSFEITTVSVDHISCSGFANGRIIIELAGGEMPYEYSIDNGTSFNPITGAAVMVAALPGGFYNLVVRDNNQCEIFYSSNPIEVIEPDELEIELEITQRGCPGDDLGEITATAFGGTMPYTFLWSNGDTNDQIAGLDEGLHSCTVFDAGACKATDNIDYSDFQEVEVDAGPDIEILPGEAAQLNVVANIQNISSVQWSPTSGLSNATVLRPFAGPSITTLYQLYILSNDGCVSTDQVIVTVLTNINDLVVPNAFSPNGDDLNDYFRPIFTPGVDLKLIMVFNRWGQVIYKSTNNIGWDGSFLGVQQPIGTYLFTIEYFDQDGQSQLKTGEVNLIR